MVRRVACCIIALCLICWVAQAAELSGRCEQVVDGDTLIVVVEGRQLTVDLAALDAPELGQPYGEEARQALEQHVLGQDIQIRVVKKLAADHVSGRVAVRDMDVNKNMIEEGFAWHDTLHDSEESLVVAQIIARGSAVGLWAGEEPQAPWEWRAQHAVVKPTPKPRRLAEMAGEVALKKNDDGKSVISQPTPAAAADDRPGGASGKNPHATGPTCCCKLVEVIAKSDGEAEEKTLFEETETYACEHAVAMMNVQTGEAKIPKFCVRWVYCETD